MKRARYLLMHSTRVIGAPALARFFMNAVGGSWFKAALGPKPRELEVVVVMRDTATGQISVDASGLREGEAPEVRYHRTFEILDFATNTMAAAVRGEHCGGDLE